MDKKVYLAIDIGASSGRHIAGYIENGVIKTEEVYRFKNYPDRKNNALVWDTARIFCEVKKGIKAAFDKYGAIESLAVDTWGVDYALINGGKAYGECYCYRDSRTFDIISKAHSAISFETLYRKTGIQYQPFNTLYQLYADKLSGRIKGAETFLMVPEYLNFLLTGKIKKEYTNATTTGLVNCVSKKFDREIISALNLPEELFGGELSNAGETVGCLLDDVAKETGGNTRVVLCASHDTASAFEAVDCADDSLILSSGTWSLLGAKIKCPITSEQARKDNFTNEGGVGYIRFLKNIAGLFSMTQLSCQSGLSFAQLEKQARKSEYVQTFDINAPEFLAPEDMREAITDWFEKRAVTPPSDAGGFANAVYNSLVLEYADTVRQIKNVANTDFKKLYIVGGGAKDKYLCDLTAAKCGIETVALPIEATAMGNLKCQMKTKEK